MGIFPDSACQSSGGSYIVVGAVRRFARPAAKRRADIVHCLGLFLIPIVVAAGGFPQVISFQGLIVDSSGAPLPDNVYAARVRVYDCSEDGKVLWESDSHVPVQVSGGLLMYALGSSNPLPDSLGRFSELWVGVSIGLGEETSRRMPLLTDAFRDTKPVPHSVESPSRQTVTIPAAVSALVSNGQDLADLIAQQKVEVEMQGSGVDLVSLKVRRLVGEPVTVHVPIGTYFVSRNSGSQNMIATAERTVVLTDTGWSTISVESSCANRPRSIPGGGDRFDIGQGSGHAELQRLMPVLNTASVEFAVRQAAVWIVTDNATYDDLGILVSRPAFQSYGGTRIIHEDEAVRAMQICDQAGIDITRKAIWNDRPTLMSGLDDQLLRNWLKRR
jgi:hypothetical protein